MFAYYAVVKSSQYTSLTSVMLLDCWSIPCVIILTWIFLKTKYGLRKFIGVGVCVAGLILVVFSDVHASDRASKDILFIKLLLFHMHFSKLCHKLAILNHYKIVELLCSEVKL